MKAFIKRLRFSLIELLVSIVVVSILASLLVPSLMAGRREALKAPCQTNQKQLFYAFEMYSADANGKIPPSQVTGYQGEGTHYLARNSGSGTKKVGLGMILYEASNSVESALCPTASINTYKAASANWENGEAEPGGEVESSYFYVETQNGVNQKFSQIGKKVLVIGYQDYIGHQNHFGDGFNVLFGTGSSKWIRDFRKEFSTTPNLDPSNSASDVNQALTELETNH